MRTHPLTSVGPQSPYLKKRRFVLNDIKGNSSMNVLTFLDLNLNFTIHLKVGLGLLKVCGVNY